MLLEHQIIQSVRLVELIYIHVSPLNSLGFHNNILVNIVQ